MRNIWKKGGADTMRTVNKDGGALLGQDGNLYALDGTLLASTFDI